MPTIKDIQMKKSILLITTTLLVVIGLAFAMSPFILSMNPSEKAKATRVSYDIKTMSAGDYIIAEHLDGENWETHVLIIKDWDGKIRSFILPSKEGKIIMPDGRWGFGYYHCSKFGPEHDDRNKIIKNGTIKCHDAEVLGWRTKEWVWTLTGISTTKYIENMKLANQEIKGNTLYISR